MYYFISSISFILILSKSEYHKKLMPDLFVKNKTHKYWLHIYMTKTRKIMKTAWSFLR